MVAVSVHQIAVMLWKLDTSLHKNDGIIDWAPPKSEETEWWWVWHPDGPQPTLFFHPWYIDPDQYPDGIADMVGYWAESRILGGVVLFDRRAPAKGGDPDAVYFHSSRKRVTYRIYQLLPEQKQALYDFLAADEPSTASSPLPILGDGNNRQRVDPEEPINETGIFRDSWERKELGLGDGDARFRDVINPLDYPTPQDKFAADMRALRRKETLEKRYYALPDSDSESGESMQRGT
jgi:hypothetical protein